MTYEHFDVVVIGAGLGGLSTAGYLARAGKRVLVLEHHTVPGGYAHEFRRGHYRFEVSLHAMDGVAPGGWAHQPLKDLGVLEQVEFTRLDPFYVARFPEHTITAWSDIYDYEQELIGLFPHEKAGIRSLFDAMLVTYHEVNRLLRDRMAGRAPAVQSIPGRFPNMLRAMTISWGEFLGEHVTDPALKGVLSTLWGYYGLPPGQLNAAAYIFPWVSYHLYGAWYPRGGSMAISRALEATLNAHGGEIRYRQTVSHIGVEDGRVRTVETDKGLVVTADAVVSNANAPDTVLRMVGPAHFPDDYVARVTNAETNCSLSNFVVYLGLDRDLAAEGFDYPELFIFHDYDHDHSHAEVLRGNFNRGLTITTHSLLDDCAPQGGSVVNLFSLAPWDFADQWGTSGDLTDYGNNPHYLELKQALADELIHMAEAHIPGLRQSIKYIEVATPLTNWRYSLNSGGAIYGSAQSVDNMYFNRLQADTPIDNLFLVGAWAFGGGYSAALLSGRDTARQVVDRLAGRSTGTYFGLGVPLPETNGDVETASPEAVVAVAHDHAPVVALVAAESGAAIDLAAPGRPLLLVCHTQDTADAGPAVNAAVREQFPLASQLVVASLVDLRGVPRLFRGIAKGAMKENYAAAVAGLPDGFDPADYVRIVPDWDGSITDALAVSEVNKTAALVLVAANGALVGRYQGDDPAAGALALLRQLPVTA